MTLETILDRDSKFDADVNAFLKATGVKPKRTSGRAPWWDDWPGVGLEAAAANCWIM